MPAPSSRLIDEYGPMPVHRPNSVAELSDIVRRSSVAGEPIYPVGGGTMVGYGLPATRPGVVVETLALNGVIDYPARDMTITVQAGITMAGLQKILTAERQRLPIDVERANEATLGGAIAANVSGPRRYGFGTWRDYVIGISVVNYEGSETKAGGRVVKNVAGYDLCKLHIGALGTLGIISRVTLKLRPIPEDKALVVVRAEHGTLPALLDSLHATRTRPVCLELLNNHAVDRISLRAGAEIGDAPWTLVVGIEGNRESLGWQVEELVRELTPAWGPRLETVIGSIPDPLWAALVEGVGRIPDALTLKANVLPSLTADFCERVVTLPEEPIFQAHAGNGIVTIHFDTGMAMERARTLIQQLLEWSGPEGNVVVYRCPDGWKKSLPVWGRPRGDLWLMRKVKQALDPTNLFNPGRFLGAI